MDGEADKTLVATVRKYWADGFSKYKTEVDVQYQLQARDGSNLWQARVQVEKTGGLGMKPEARMKRLYEDALQDLAKSALEHFKSAEFRGSSPGAGTGTGAKLYAKDGTFFGEVVGALGDNVVVTLSSGVRATISLSQAAEMMRPDSTPATTATPAAPLTAPALTLGLGSKLYGADGGLLGEVVSMDGDRIMVNISNGQQITITRAQAMAMLDPKRSKTKP